MSTPQRPSSSDGGRCVVPGRTTRDHGRVADVPVRSHRKGRIAVGLDADLAIVDVQGEHTPSRDNLHSSAGYSIYEGVTLRGRVRHTLVNGRFVCVRHDG